MTAGRLPRGPTTMALSNLRAKGYLTVTSTCPGRFGS